MGSWVHNDWVDDIPNEFDTLSAQGQGRDLGEDLNCCGEIVSMSTMLRNSQFFCNPFVVDPWYERCG